MTRRQAPPLRSTRAPHRGAGKHTGLTLLEILLAAGLLLLVSVLLISVLLPFARYSGRESALMGLRQGAEACLDRLEGDLLRSAAGGVHALAPGAGPVLLAIQPLAGRATDGAPVWAGSLVTWRWDPVGPSLVRREMSPPWPQGLSPLAEGFVPHPLDRGELSLLASAPPVGDRHRAAT